MVYVISWRRSSRVHQLVSLYQIHHHYFGYKIDVLTYLDQTSFKISMEKLKFGEGIGCDNWKLCSKLADGCNTVPA
jgi:hypothetical protein